MTTSSSLLRKSWYWPLLRERLWAEWTADLIQNGTFCVVSHTSHHFLQSLWGEKSKTCRNWIVSAFGLKFGFTKAFPLNSSEICFDWEQGLTPLDSKFLRIIFLQHNLQDKLWQNAGLCPGFEFLKFFLWSDWKYLSLAGWKVVKSPWQASKTGYSWPPWKVM